MFREPHPAVVLFLHATTPAHPSPPSALHSPLRCSVAPPARGEADAQRRTFPPPRQVVAGCPPRHSTPHPLGRPSPPIAYPSPHSALHRAAKQRKPCHRGTRTLNPLADRAAAPSKPNFHHPTADAPQGAVQHPHLHRGGDEDQQRTYPPPRQGRQPCAAPAGVPLEDFVIDCHGGAEVALDVACCGGACRCEIFAIG